MQSKLSKLAALGTVLLSIVLVISACGKEKTLQEKQDEAKASIGIEASLAAGFLVAALRQCHRIGTDSIDKCAEQKGVLIDEQTAQTVAQLGVEKRTSYFKNCRATMTEEYCKELIMRAVNIELSR